MPFALTLVGSKAPLTAGHIAVIERYITGQGISILREPEWLSPHKAADIIFSDNLTLPQMAALRGALIPDRIDALCTNTLGRRKKLLCADMESTIIENEMLEELAESLGLKEKIAAITARSMNGEIDFVQSLKERVAMLKGLPVKTLEAALPTLKINEGAPTLVKTMAAQGARCVLITGGFTFFSGYIAEKLGFHHHHANDLETQDGVLTGGLSGAILDPGAKLQYLKHYCQTLAIPQSDSLALGDGANDLPMLSTAGLGIGYRPKPVLRTSLTNQILYGDFTTALYAQGYTENDFRQ